MRLCVLACKCACVSIFHLTHWNDSVNYFSEIHHFNEIFFWLWLCFDWTASDHLFINRTLFLLKVEYLLLITYIFSCYEKCLRNVCSQVRQWAHSVERKIRRSHTWNTIKMNIDFWMMIESEMHSSIFFAFHSLSLFVEWTNKLSNNATSLNMGLFICLFFVRIDQTIYFKIILLFHR